MIKFPAENRERLSHALAALKKALQANEENNAELMHSNLQVAKCAMDDVERNQGRKS